MEIYTTQPAIQLYTGNFLDGTQQARWQKLNPALRFLPGNAAFSRLAEPAVVPVCGVEARRDVHAQDCPQVQREIAAVAGSE